MASEEEESKRVAVEDQQMVRIDGLRVDKATLKITPGIGETFVVRATAGGTSNVAIAFYRVRDDAVQLIQDIRAAVHPKLRIDGDGILRIVEPKRRKSAKGGAV